MGRAISQLVVVWRVVSAESSVMDNLENNAKWQALLPQPKNLYLYNLGKLLLDTGPHKKQVHIGCATANNRATTQADTSYNCQVAN